jgi:putative transposase
MRRRKFSREFKLEAVRLVRELTADSQQAFPGHGQMKPEQLEIDRLGKEVAKLKAECGILKKGRSLLREGSDMRFAFIAKHRNIWPVAWLCDALAASRSGFHALLNRSPSARSRQDEMLFSGIGRSFKSSDRTYGARHVWHDVLAEGFSCGLHRVERLMRENGLRARRRRRGLPKDTGARAVMSDNLLDRAFEAAAPNQKWVAGFTCIWTAEGCLYVAVVVDLFSRRVVGWAMKAEMTEQLVTEALMMASWRRGKPDSLMHHSDQGSQYTSELFQRLMADHAIICSMSRSGNVWNNAAMESFFSSLKTERSARKVYRTRDNARADVFDYIERFYNPRRRHSTLSYLSFVEFEEQAMLA